MADRQRFEGTHAIRAEGLRKTFGKTEALKGVDVSVPTGTVLGLLGPNGAGKTTTVPVGTETSTPFSASV